MASLSSIAFAVRASCKTNNLSVSLSHIQQLVAASFGYRSFASYQASNDLKEFQSTEAIHFLLDNGLFLQRFAELQIVPPNQAINDLIRNELKTQLPHAHLYSSDFDLDSYVRDTASRFVLNDDDISGEMAMTNSNGIKEVYLPFEDIDLQSLPLCQPEDFEVSGHVSMELDLERPYSGHRIDVDLTVTLEKVTKVCLLEPVFEVTRAKLSYAWDDDEELGHPKTSLAKALAAYFDLELIEAEELDDAEAVADESNEGLISGHLFNFEHHASPDLARKLIKKFGSLELKVPASFFDNVKR